MQAFTKRNFCKSLGLGVHIDWIDTTGLREISAETFARIELSEGGVSGKFDRLEVSILHHTRGLLDRKTFLFDDFFSERADDRQEYPLKNGFHAWPKHADTFEWYIAVPAESSKSALALAVETYLKFFR